jgi:Methyltransferase domain
MRSQLCTQNSLSTVEYQRWATLFGNANHMHRKIWEWSFICEALNESGVLRPGSHGLGFAVGEEPLTSIFASHGAQILATDLDVNHAATQGWSLTGQHAKNKDILNKKGLCEPALFDRLVDFDFVDMNAIPSNYNNLFDFVWSSCALEHLGSLDNGLNFIIESLKTLKKGGIAVHTTEFNICSDNMTIETGATVLYRKKDILNLCNRINQEGYIIDDINWDYGTGALDYFVDIPPYKHNPHLKFKIQDFIVTSIGLIIRKPCDA